MSSIRFTIVNPGHFHAALVQKEMYPDVAETTHVYAPLGPDLMAHLQRLVQFNTRADNPTSWRVEVHTGPDFLERLARETPGNVVVLAGYNAHKLEAIEAAIAAGVHVLADKPWILTPEQLPRLKAVLDKAEQQKLIAYDIMTERHEITSMLQAELCQDAVLLGGLDTGSADNPGVVMESMHYLKKTVAGVPLRRPAWFFDVNEQGEGLSDVGTHLVDLVPWMLFPAQPIDPNRDVRLQAAKRWPTAIDKKSFLAITGELDFPVWLRPAIKGDSLPYFCNTQVTYQVRGVWVRLDVLWDLEAAAGAGDTHRALVRGRNANIEILQGPDQKYRPELFVSPIQKANAEHVKESLLYRVRALQHQYPGVDVHDHSRAGETRFHVTIPDSFRHGHEAHFAQVTRQFLRYVRGEEKMPAWERSNMLAKYRVTTEGVALSSAAGSS